MKANQPAAKAAGHPPKKPTPEPRENGDDEPVKVPITRNELRILFNAARALHLLELSENADGEQPLLIYGVLFGLTADPAYEVVTRLRGRFRDEELRAAGHGEEIDRFTARIGN